ncbi:hypothetical protein E2P81_ATG01472 [Venturia nashicola]|uniref:C2H2-type domain-containing protein n=1 Tax=Venturia nashicola TaxID=86259 RepID=A0A4Z1PS95_9PEZI|nr:hypothetical protein E6O75_ATG01508 [Venturia nashicola]TLD38929.1 hypothetical protein E2P81_ATG01472 [Venturia nashicola]
MPDSSQTPPSLCNSPSVSGSRRGSTPVTPLTTPHLDSEPWPPTAAVQPKKNNQLYFSWRRKEGADKPISNPLLGSDWHFAQEEALFESCRDRHPGDISFPLFPESPPRPTVFPMASAAPIDISLPPRLSSNSQSPRNQTSNLTFALQEAQATGQAAPEAYSRQPLAAPDAGRLGVNAGGRQGSMSNIFGSSYYNGTGARPISVKDRNRGESNTAGSFMNGMSWGNNSVGSWIQQDIMMAGTSPAPYGRSPSLHSSSYLPKAEANFLKDYKCCGLTLDSLHELLQHFEENHAQPSHQIAHRASVSSQTGASGGRRPSTGMSAVETTRGFPGFDQQRTQQPVRPVNPQTSNQQGKDGFSRTQLSTVQDVDTMDDLEMEMDESTDLFAPQQHRSQTSQSNSGFNINSTSSGNVPAQQAFRTSAPTTPSTGQPFAQFGNPTVSSVNTPALNTNEMQQAQGLMSPNHSIPGTPGELDPNFATDFLSGDGNFGALSTDYSLMDFGQPGIGFGLENNLDHMTIDDPAKRLYSKQGGMNNNQFQFGNKSGPMSMDGEMAKRLREQQLIGNLGGPIPGFPEPEQKPFKCPVIGCEKSYKNQNGLKYHKQHGHQNQQLQENADGTYSIVDPTTSIPYPGTIGMEKEKPYRCEVCGKRYKNLNGLKYHRQHSPPCNPENMAQKLNPLAGLTNNLHGLNPNANVAGAGLAGMPENMF